MVCLKMAAIFVHMAAEIPKSPMCVLRKLKILTDFWILLIPGPSGLRKDVKKKKRMKENESKKMKLRQNKPSENLLITILFELDFYTLLPLQRRVRQSKSDVKNLKKDPKTTWEIRTPLEGLGFRQRCGFQFSSVTGSSAS